MLDIKQIRENPELFRERLLRKGDVGGFERLLELDASRRTLIEATDKLKARRNAISKEIAERARSGADVSAHKIESREVGERISKGNDELRDIESQLKDILLRLPNPPHSSVPLGRDSRDNVVRREWGTERTFDGHAMDHLALADALKILDFPRGTKITGSGFPVYRAAGAILERAIINFMLDLHRSRGRYIEVSTPFVVNRASLLGTSQLPKFEDDLYRCDTDDLFLIPTAEVPITNLHRDELLQEDDLPIYYCGYSPCFRREAGSYGKETRGFLRVHQFDKVELVKFVLPETSYDELEALVLDASAIMEALDLRYRVVELCTGDLSFGAAKCYDLEVWAPVEKKWLEVSS
ncbi:MAG: serine--tRNA ligase, partial [bacterium]|nr:serine--tRNA ligase [bacterium]